MTRLLLPVFLAAATSLHAQLLPGTQPLEPNADFSATMVAGIDKMALRLIEQSKATRKPDREKLKTILGVVDQRLPIKALELLGTTTAPALSPRPTPPASFASAGPSLTTSTARASTSSPRRKPAPGLSTSPMPTPIPRSSPTTPCSPTAVARSSFRRS